MRLSLARQNRTDILHRTLMKLLEIEIHTETSIDIPQPTAGACSNRMHIHDIPSSSEDPGRASSQIEIERRICHLKFLVESSIVRIRFPQCEFFGDGIDAGAGNAAEEVALCAGGETGASDGFGRGSEPGGGEEIADDGLEIGNRGGDYGDGGGDLIVGACWAGAGLRSWSASGKFGWRGGGTRLG